MGLNASVMCNCFRDGKTIPPPFPREWLEVDREGRLNLTKEHDDDARWARLYAWQQSCCEHEGMDYAFEHISNWTGYRWFQQALGEVGWQHFPVLKEQLPNVNGGLTPSTASAKAREELHYFATRGEIGVKTVLVDTTSGEKLREYVAAYDGVFLLGGGVKAGLSEFGFFAVDAMSGEVLFRATRFRQFNRSGEEMSWNSGGIVWEDLDTGAVFEPGTAIHGKQIPWEDGSWQNTHGQCRFEYPSKLHVEQRQWLVSDFDYIVTALNTVLDASVQTGNPVRWS